MPARAALLLIRLTLSACLLGASGCGQAATRPLVFAFSELEPFKTQDGEHFGGAYTEIVRDLAKRLGLSLQILPCPLKRCLLLLQEGKADIIIGVQSSSQRSQFLHFLPTPYRRRGADKVFYVAAGQASRIQNYADLSNLQIGVKNGAQYFSRFDDDTSLHKNVLVNFKANFKKLELGRLDAVIIAEDQGEAVVSQLGLRSKVEKARYREPDHTPRQIGISKKSPHAARLAEFEAAMQAMRTDGTLGKLFQQYYFQAWQVPANSVQIE